MTEAKEIIVPEAFEGDFRVSQKFWNYWPQKYKTNGGHHNGTDFAVPVGTPLLALFDGWVSRIERWQLTGYGRMIVLRSNCGHYEALYGHMSEIDGRLDPGDKVKFGQEIGKSGNTGNSTGPHLHLSIWKDGKLIDPEAFMKQPALFEVASPEAEQARTHSVVSGETLSGIARAYLGSSARWPEIFAANSDTMSDPSKIRVGQVLKIPSTQESVTEIKRTIAHTVVRGETLSGLAMRYLGSGARWEEIYEANRTKIGNPNMIVAGLVLEIHIT